MDEAARIQKLWLIFKDVLTEAHQELRDADLTVNELRFHRANVIVKQIVEQLSDEILAPENPPPY